MAVKQKELEAEANELITKGGKVSPQGSLSCLDFFDFVLCFLINITNILIHCIRFMLLYYPMKRHLCSVVAIFLIIFPRYLQI